MMLDDFYRMPKEAWHEGWTERTWREHQTLRLGYVLVLVAFAIAIISRWLA